MLSPAQIREAFQTLKGIHLTLIDIRDELILTRKNRECVAISERKAADIAALRAADYAAQQLRILSPSRISFTERAAKGKLADAVHNPERRSRRQCALCRSTTHPEHYWDGPVGTPQYGGTDRLFCDGVFNQQGFLR